VLDILVQSRRNKEAAIRFLRRLLRRMHYAPRVIVTDKLKSYGAAIKELEIQVDHRHTRASITGQRIPTNPYARGNAPCGGSSRQSKHSGFWHRLV
jgi:hypothetical protein